MVTKKTDEMLDTGYKPVNEVIMRKGQSGGYGMSLILAKPSSRLTRVKSAQQCNL